MKTISRYTFIAGFTMGLLLTAAAQQAADSPAPTQSQTATPAAADTKPAVEAAAPAKSNTATNAAGEKLIQMNFRGASLETVLVHMAEAAGFIINVDPRIRLQGRITVLAPEPVNREDAFKVLATALLQNNYAVSRDGRTISVMSIEDVSKHTPIVGVGTPAIQIPKSPRMVTQMIAVKSANAAQLTQDLLPLLPDNAIMTANSSGNTLLITATESDVKRMAEIVEAIDASISNNTQLKVFPLKHADAKELATIVTQLFDTSSQRGGGRGNVQFNLGGRGGGGGF